MDFDSQLIKLVKQYPFLYVKKDIKFRDKNAKEEAWEKIGGVLNQTGAECEHRWTMLRSRFSSELRTVKQTPPASGPSKPQWGLFNALLFLEGHVVRRRTTWGNVKQTKPEPDPDPEPSQPTYNSQMSAWSSLKVELDESESSNHSSAVSDIPAESCVDVSQGSVHPTINQQNGTNVNIKSTRKRPSTIEDTVGPSIKDAAQKFSKYIDVKEKLLSSPSVPVVDNEDISFGRSLGFTLMKIKNEKAKVKLKSKIMGLVGDILD